MEEFTSSRSYLFLFGSADTFNMIVPLNCDAYDDYVDIRSDNALTPDEVLQISIARSTSVMAGSVCS